MSLRLLEEEGQRGRPRPPDPASAPGPVASVPPPGAPREGSGAPAVRIVVGRPEQAEAPVAPPPLLPGRVAPPSAPAGTQREISIVSALPRAPSRPGSERPRLGDLLLRSGLVEPHALREALAAQARAGGRLGTLLVELGYLSEHELSRSLGQQLGVPFADAVQLASIPPDLARMVPRELAERHRIVPLELGPGHVRVAMEDPSSARALSELAAALDRRVVPVVAAESSIARALERHYGIEHRPRTAVRRPRSGREWTEPSAVPEGDGPGAVRRPRSGREWTDSPRMEPASASASAQRAEGERRGGTRTCSAAPRPDPASASAQRAEGERRGGRRTCSAAPRPVWAEASRDLELEFVEGVDEPVTTPTAMTIEPASPRRAEAPKPAPIRSMWAAELLAAGTSDELLEVLARGFGKRIRRSAVYVVRGQLARCTFRTGFDPARGVSGTLAHDSSPILRVVSSTKRLFSGPVSPNPSIPDPLQAHLGVDPTAQLLAVALFGDGHPAAFLLVGLDLSSEHAIDEARRQCLTMARAAQAALQILTLRRIVEECGRGLDVAPRVSRPTPQRVALPLPPAPKAATDEEPTILRGTDALWG